MTESFSHEIPRLLSPLSDRERKIIELTYGMTGDYEMAPAKIAPLVGLSIERVRQLRDEALKKLRENPVCKF